MKERHPDQHRSAVLDDRDHPAEMKEGRRKKERINIENEILPVLKTKEC
ncbi:MAG: hypothetical protein ACI8RD_009550 [Bacillariaceae sp.]|jgi:hypothetical protein